MATRNISNYLKLILEHTEFPAYLILDIYFVISEHQKHEQI